MRTSIRTVWARPNICQIVTSWGFGSDCPDGLSKLHNPRGRRGIRRGSDRYKAKGYLHHNFSWMKREKLRCRCLFFQFFPGKFYGKNWKKSKSGKKFPANFAEIFFQTYRGVYAPNGCPCAPDRVGLCYTLVGRKILTNFSQKFLWKISDIFPKNFLTVSRVYSFYPLLKIYNKNMRNGSLLPVRI